MKKKKLRDHVSIKEVVRSISAVLLDYLLLFKEWITDYGKVILPIVLLGLVSGTVFFALNAREKVEAAAQEALSVLEETKAEVQQLQETPFEIDAYPDLNYIVNLYYDALQTGDVDALNLLQNNVTNTEMVRLEKMSKYIDRYEDVHVYSKPGPYVDTFIVYATSNVFLKDHEQATPGLQAFYICINEYGTYYINTGELAKDEAEYITNIANQADVIDLKNTVNVNYNAIMEEDAELCAYWAEVSVDIDLAVGEQFAMDALVQAQIDAEENGSQVQEEEDDNEELGEVVPKITRVKTTSGVNVRKSASQTADKIGYAEAGQTFDLIEIMLNGWTKISYNGSEGFIKSEYLKVLEDLSVYNTIGVVKATSLLNVRAEADSSSDKLGVLNQGATADLIEVVGDWCKIKYNGQIGYVFKEYVEY